MGPAGQAMEQLPLLPDLRRAVPGKYAAPGLGPGEGYLDRVARADSLAALAGKIGVDGQLAATVARFNDNALRGEDPDFSRGASAFVRRRYGDRQHRPNANLGPVSEPPFYALPLRLLGTGMCTFGLSTDTDARVLRRDGSAVEGLFATGNAVATTEFRNYVTGYANSRNFAMAYAAMNAAAGVSPQTPASSLR